MVRRCEWETDHSNNNLCQTCYIFLTFFTFFRDVCTFCAIFGIVQVVCTIGSEMTIVLKGCDPANAQIYH